MAYEITDWKAAGCSLNLATAKLSKREPSSSEINKRFGEGGGLNANYTTVEAVAVVANMLGAANIRYGEHVVFKTAGLDEISFDFCDIKTKEKAKAILKPYLI